MDLFKLLGTITINNSDANEALEETGQKAEKTQGKLSKAFSVVGKGAAVAGKVIGAGLVAGGAAMGALTVQALNLSGELEQNMGGSEQVFKEYAGKMQETAKNAFQNMGLSTSDFLGTANKMGALFQGAGFSIEESSGLASDAMQRAADVASIMGIDTASAMEAIAGAAKGNFTMMDNLGVAMNDTTLNAYALEKGIGKTTQEMTNQEKIALAMEMFMEKTSYAAGNYAKENETLAGALGTAKSALTNFLDGSGDVDSLVSAFSNAADVIVDNLTELAPRLVSGLTEIINKVIPMLPPLLNQLLPVIVEGAVSLINGLVSALPMVIDVLLSALPALIDGITKIINALIQALPTIMESLFSALPTLLPMLIDALVSMTVMLCSQFGEIIQPIIDYVPEIIDSIVTAILENLPMFLEAGGHLLMGLLQGMITLIGNIPDVLATIFNAIINGIKALFGIHSPSKVMAGIGKNIIEGLINGVTSLLDKCSKLFTSLWSGVKNIFANVGSWFGEKFSDAWDRITKIFSNVGSFFSGIWGTIQSTFSELGTKISDAISGAVKKGINGVIGGAENIINGFFKMINGAISLINEIPGVNITKIKMVEFTRLAKGGVVDKATPAVFGEDGAELLDGNTVIPLENNTGWMDKVASRLHTLMTQRSDSLGDKISIRSVELQQMQVSELQTLNHTVNKILDAILVMDENMGGHLRDAIDGVSFDVNKREFARLVKESV